MTRIHLTVAGHRFSFGSGALLAFGAIIGIVVLFSAYLDALRHSVERGHLLREAQRADISVRRDAARYDTDLSMRNLPRVATLSR